MQDVAEAAFLKGEVLPEIKEAKIIHMEIPGEVVEITFTDGAGVPEAGETKFTHVEIFCFFS